MAHQISVFVQNKPGRLERVTDILTKADVNIRAFTVSGTYEYGVMKFLVNQPDRALEALRTLCTVGSGGALCSRRALRTGGALGSRRALRSGGAGCALDTL